VDKKTDRITGTNQLIHGQNQVSLSESYRRKRKKPIEKPTRLIYWLDELLKKKPIEIPLRTEESMD